MEYTKEFKQALSEFSPIEKDRLIFRLLKKDKLLSKKLYFELIDPETGRILEANAAACRYYGYAKEEFTGLEITKINVQSPDLTSWPAAWSIGTSRSRTLRMLSRSFPPVAPQ